MSDGSGKKGGKKSGGEPRRGAAGRERDPQKYCTLRTGTTAPLNPDSGAVSTAAVTSRRISVSSLKGHERLKT